MEAERKMKDHLNLLGLPTTASEAVLLASVSAEIVSRTTIPIFTLHKGSG